MPAAATKENARAATNPAIAKGTAASGLAGKPAARRTATGTGTTGSNANLTTAAPSKTLASKSSTTAASSNGLSKDAAQKAEERRLKLEQYRKEREEMKNRAVQARKPAVPGQATAPVRPATKVVPTARPAATATKSTSPVVASKPAVAPLKVKTTTIMTGRTVNSSTTSPNTTTLNAKKPVSATKSATVPTTQQTNETAKPKIVNIAPVTAPLSVRKTFAAGPSLADATAAVESSVLKPRSLAIASSFSDSPSASRGTAESAFPQSVRRLLPQSVRRLLPQKRDGQAEMASSSTPMKSLAVEVGLSNFEERLKSVHKLQRKLSYGTSSPVAAPVALAPTTSSVSPQDSNHASLWIAKARDLELLGWWEGALACFREAKKRGAFPTEMLELEFEAFKARLGEPVLLEVETGSDPGLMTMDDEMEVESVKPSHEEEVAEPELEPVAKPEEAVEEVAEAMEPMETTEEEEEEQPMEAEIEADDESIATSTPSRTPAVDKTQTFEMTMDEDAPDAFSVNDIAPETVEFEIPDPIGGSPNQTQPFFITPRKPANNVDLEDSPPSPPPPISSFDLDRDPISPAGSNSEYFGQEDAERSRLSFDGHLPTTPGQAFAGLSPKSTGKSPAPRDRSRKSQVEDMVKILSTLSINGSPEQRGPAIKPDPDAHLLAQSPEGMITTNNRERSATPRPGHLNPLRTKAETMVTIGPQPSTGMMTVLTPVRAKPKEREMLGVPSYVTPVRRSVRTLDDSTEVKVEPTANADNALLAVPNAAVEVKPKTPGAKLQEMLESVGYAYAPNEAVAVDRNLVKQLLQDGRRAGSASPSRAGSQSPAGTP